MIQIKLTKDSKYGARNSVKYVTRNIAHDIIDEGVGEIYKRNAGVYSNAMLESEGYKKADLKTKRKSKISKK